MTDKNYPSLRDIRQSFLDFFAGRGHTLVPSSSLVPHDDPTLLFTNAGMVQFKNLFTGLESREYTRAVTSQKCVRAGGKHNDLDNVGYTARHLTFFEMLGNFSFGDYFKDEAIDAAWELVTNVFGLPKERLVVTVFHEDDEAFDLWRKIAGLPEDKIIRIATSDNFWSMGDTGPCGPCSEIFFDHGPSIAGGPPGSPDEDGDRFVEIWNLVFMQYDSQADGSKVALPKPSIDTGMGLERMSTVLQGVHNVYDVDLFRTLIEASADLIKRPLGGPDHASYRVISDHVRSSSFLIADGVLPSNEGRGYVLRRILRRAMRHAHILGAEDPVLHKIAPTLITEMGAAFPELKRAEALILESLHGEEVRFREMLERGLRLLSEETDTLTKGDRLSGAVAFKLYDTYGFPLDLTQDALRPRGIEVDVAGFDASMDEQRAVARAAWAGSGDTATEEVWFQIRERIGATTFTGYDAETGSATVKALVVAGEEVSSAEPGTSVLIVTDTSPFYGESGGQVGDEGVLKSETGAEAVVSDTKKMAGDVVVHMATIERGALAVGDTITLRVDVGRRGRVRANHSATHLLHEALRRVLGPHVAQKGSLVAPDRLRFDFAHSKAMSREEIVAVEVIVNETIRQNAPVGTAVMNPDDAVKAGALALFGEKYGEEVRVLTMGLDENSERIGSYDTGAFSVELCGGTHVRRLGDIQVFKIISEGAVGSGVRRLEALTGEAARRYLTEQEERLIETAEALKVRPDDAAARVKQLLDERRKLERELAEAKKTLALSGGGGAKKDRVRSVGNLKLIADVLEGIPAKELRGLIDEAKTEIGSGVVALIAADGGKAAIAIGVTDDLKDKISAVDLVRAAVPALGGKGGGGRPDMAQAGGPNADGASEAIAAIETAIRDE